MASKGPFKLLGHGDCYPCKDSTSYSYIGENIPKNIEKESSKNLVPSPLEDGFQESKMIKPTRGNCALSALTYALLFSLFVWLLALTFVRELQISKIHSEIEVLKTDLEKMRHKLPDETLNDLNLFEDAIYTELEAAGREVASEAESDAGRGAKRGDRGGAETREDDDEDDGADEAYGESGDWSYLDYDKKRATIDASDDAIVAVESDVLGAVMETRQAPPTRNVVHVPDESKSSDDSRGKRETALPLEEQLVDKSFFAEADYNKKYAQRKRGLDRAKVDLRTLRKFEQLKKTSKRFNIRDSRDIDETEESAEGAFVAAHFEGDTTHLGLADTHNGLLHVPHAETHAAWRPAGWLAAAGADRHLELEPAGAILVKTPGLYFLYAQIFYYDRRDSSGWLVEVDGLPALQCSAARGGTHDDYQPASCYSARVIALTAGQRLRARNSRGSRAAIMRPDRSFIGLFKLADLPSL